MSASGTGCTCPKPKPIPGNDKRRMITPKYLESWVTVYYRCNYSAFNGYRRTPSDYSLVACLVCGRSWRTKAAYVMCLHELSHEERQKWSMRTLKLTDLATRYD